MKVAQFGMMLAATTATLSIYACEKSNPTEVAPETRVEASSVMTPASASDRMQKGGIVMMRRTANGGFDGGATSSSRGPLTPHSGLILDHTNTYAIFWGPAWSTNSQFRGDKITSIQSFFSGFGGSNYANTLTEYGTTSQSTFVTTIMDNSVAPNFDPGSAILGGHLCALLDSHGIAPDYYAFYAVYTTARYIPNPNGYLGYHDKVTCHNVTIHEALLFTADSVSSTDFSFVTDNIYHSNNAAELVNVTAHELAETITDPDVSSGWYAIDGKGEVGDKCNFTFNSSAPFLTLHNGSVFKLQGEWSNTAFYNATGAPNGNVPTEKGCVFSSAPWVRATVSGPIVFKQSQQSTFSAPITAGTPPYTYIWQISSPLTFGYSSTTSSTFTITLYSSVPTQTQYTVTAIITDALGHQISPRLVGNAYPGF